MQLPENDTSSPPTEHMPSPSTPTLPPPSPPSQETSYEAYNPDHLLTIEGF
jgi:hypothetical protein